MFNTGLCEEVKLLLTMKKRACTINSSFNSVVKQLKIPINEDRWDKVIDIIVKRFHSFRSCDYVDIDDPILRATGKCKRYRSILKVKENTKIQNQFCFKHVTSKDYKRYKYKS